jgi:hypothetical protein
VRYLRASESPPTPARRIRSRGTEEPTAPPSNPSTTPARRSLATGPGRAPEAPNPAAAAAAAAAGRENPPRSRTAARVPSFIDAAEPRRGVVAAEGRRQQQQEAGN